MPRLEPLALAAARGCESAARTLIAQLWSHWSRQIRSSSALRALPSTEDDIANVLVLLVEKAGTPGSRALQRYPAWQARHRDKTFLDWMRIVAANTVRDYVRFERRRLRPESPANTTPTLFDDCWSEDGALCARPVSTGQITAHQLLAFAESHLEYAQLTALVSWLEGDSFAELADELGCSPESARRTLRAGLAKIRRRFSDPRTQEVDLVLRRSACDPGSMER